MPKTRIPSPARSQGATTPKRKKSRGSRSLCSPALSTASGRLTSLIDQFKDKNMELFALSPLNRRSILNDDTAIEEPRRKSWWKNLKEDSQQIMEVLEENKVTDANNGIEELIDIEVLSQEKKEYTLDLPESSDNESINSIVLPQRKLFTQKDSKPQKKFGQFSDNRETLAKLHKTNTNVDKTVNVGTRELFQNAKRSKPIFPSALLNISPNKTTADKTKENILQEPKVRNIFGNRPTNKRKNMFADFVVSESEDEIPEIQPRVFGFQKKLEQRRISSISKGREGSPASSITTDMEMDDWKLLPSSTMVENQLEDIVAGHTPKRARLSKLSEAGTNTEAGINTIQTNTTGDKTKASNKSVTSKNKSKSSPDVKDKSLNSSRTTRSMMKNTSKLEEKIEAPKQNTKINKSQDKISSKDNELDDSSSKVANKQNTSLNKSQRLNKSRTRNSSKIIEEEKEGDENADNDKNPINNVTRVINKNGSNATLSGKSINEKERTITLKVHDKANEAGSNNEEDENQFTLQYENDENEIAEEIVEHNKINENKANKIKNRNTMVIEKDNQETDANKSKSNKSIHNELKQAKIVEESVESTNEQSANDNVDGNEIQNTEIDKNYEHQDADNVSHELNEQRNNSEGEKNVTNNIEDEENEEEMNVSQENDHETNENDNTDEVILSKVDEENESEIDEENVDVNQSNENEEPNESQVEAEVDGSQEIDEQNESQEMNEEADDSKIEENALEDENNESEEESQEVQNDEEEDDVDESQEEDDAEDNDESQELENQEVSQGEHEVSQEEHEVSQEVENDEENEVENDDVSQEVEQDVENNEESQEIENDEEENEQSQEVEDDEEEDEESQEIDNEEDNQVESEAEVNESEEIEDDKAMDNSDEADKAIASDPEISDRDDNDAEEMEFDDDDNNEQESENEEAEGNEEESHEEQLEPSAEEIEESPNVTHDTTGRHRQKELKSPEAILHDKTNQMDSFTAKGRNTSIRKTKSMIKNLNIRPSLAPQRDSLAFSDGTRDSSAEGSGWDSHRTTRKTLRQTFGKDFTPRKSLRALVMEKSAKRQTEHQDLHSDTVKYPQANSTELPEYSNGHVEDFVESDHEVSRRTRQTTLETYLQKIKQQNIENKVKMEQLVRNSLKAPSRDTLSLFKVPNKPAPRRLKLSQNKPRTQIKSIMAFGELPTEVIEDMKYKPPKRFQPTNASWITKRLYKFLETKLEPKYDYKARVRAEKLVETIYHFAKDLRRHNVAPTDAVDVLKHELARLEVVQTHFDFYEFFHEFMPREIRVKVVPDIVNKIPLPRHGVFSDILRGNNVQG